MTSINNEIENVEAQVESLTEINSSFAQTIEGLNGTIKSLKLELLGTAEAVELAEAWDYEFSGEDVGDVAYELGSWREHFPYDDASDVAEKLSIFENLGDPDEVESELEEYRALGTPEELCEMVDAGGKVEQAELEELRKEVERQANLIARLAGALDDIDTIVGAELAGTGGQVETRGGSDE